MKTLFFEGAGWEEAESSKETIDNCRIRTAFTNNSGKKIYLEMGTSSNKMKDYRLFIDHVFYITGNNDDENVNRITHDWKNTMNCYRYSIKDITKWINENLDCNFDSILVLPHLSGYKVHKDGNGYNLVNAFNYNIELTSKREEIERYFYNLEKSEGKKYPNFNLWVDDIDENILHLLRSFNGYNKHWTIDTRKDNTNNWIEVAVETKLGKYGC